MNEELQWEANPGEKLKIPVEMRKRIQFKALIKASDKDSTVVYCRAFDAGITHLHLYGCIADTSDRHQGMILKKRFTYHDDMYFFNMQVMLFPYKEVILEESEESK